MKIFAVICNGSAEGLQDALATFDPPASCLYNEPIDPNTFRNAPFLVEVTETFKPWLAAQTTPWGLYLLTNKEVTFNELRQHLRRYTYAKIPSEEVPVLFRFYDPRFFWKFVEVIDDWNLHAMLGPIEIVASHYGELKQDHFEERRKSYPRNAKMRGMFLTLTNSQEALIDASYKKDYQDYLAKFMWKYADRTILDEINHDSELIHASMLKYQRDVKGVEITHPLDHYLIEKYFLNKEVRYIYMNHHWYFVEHEYAKPLKKDSIILKELNKLKGLGYTDVSESLFHNLTHQRYEYLIEKRKEVKIAQAISKEYMPTNEEEFRADIYQLAEDLCDFFQAQEIVDERSIKALIHFININKRIYRFKDIPEEWLDQLRKDQNSGEYRARSFLLDVLGYVPTTRELNLLFKEVN